VSAVVIVVPYWLVLLLVIGLVLVPYVLAVRWADRKWIDLWLQRRVGATTAPTRDEFDYDLLLNYSDESAAVHACIDPRGEQRPAGFCAACGDETRVRMGLPRLPERSA